MAASVYMTIWAPIVMGFPLLRAEEKSLGLALLGFAFFAGVPGALSVYGAHYIRLILRAPGQGGDDAV